MSKAEPRWKRHCRFLAALNDDNVSLAWTLLCGREGPPVDPDIRIMTGGEYKPAICIAVERDLLEMAELLIMRGCSVNQFAPTGLSPLHVAVMRNNIAMVRLLLKSGASVSCRDSSGRTPLHHLAVCNYSDGSLEIARLLVQKGSKTEHRDGSGATPLALACQGHRDLALCLLSLGANAGAADNEGDTPLHHTCTKLPNDEELVKQLLAAGVRVAHVHTTTDTAEFKMTFTPKPEFTKEADKMITAKGFVCSKAAATGKTPCSAQIASAAFKVKKSGGGGPEITTETAAPNPDGPTTDAPKPPGPKPDGPKKPDDTPPSAPHGSSPNAAFRWKATNTLPTAFMVPALVTLLIIIALRRFPVSPYAFITMY